MRGCVITEEFLLEDVTKYRYLTNGLVQCSEDDQELYTQLLEAMDIMAISKEERSGNHWHALHIHWVGR